jgi:hypothetical protein
MQKVKEGQDDIQQEDLSHTRNTSSSDYRPRTASGHYGLQKSILDRSFEQAHKEMRLRG